MESLRPVARLARQREKKDLADEDEDEGHGVAMACGEAG